MTYSFEGRLNEDDWESINRYMFWIILSKPIFWLTATFLAAFEAMILISLLTKARESVAPWICAIAVFAAFIAWLYFPVHVRKASRRQYRKLKDHFQFSKVTFHEPGFSIESESTSKSSRWSVIWKVLETPDGLLFYTRTYFLWNLLFRASVPFFLPVRVLPTGLAYDELKAFLANAGVKVYRVP